MFSRYQQRMTGKQWTMIKERNRMLIFVNHGCREFTRHNSTKQTVVFHYSPSLSFHPRNPRLVRHRLHGFYPDSIRETEGFVESRPDEVPRSRKTFFHPLTQALEEQNQRHNRASTLRQR